jgi:hypothetical protein
MKTATSIGLLASLCVSLLNGNLNAGQRPISDFLSRQGQWSLHVDSDGSFDCAASSYDGGLSGFLFDPPIRNFPDLTEPQNGTSASFDYAGLVDAAAGHTLGTAMSGSINEVVHPDGSVTVSILLNTTQALAWATTGFNAYGTDLFGHTGLEVLGGASPAFGSCTMRLVINGPASNQPLPDFEELLIGCSNWSLASFHFVGSASGPLPDGSAGRLEVTQVGLIAVASKANPHSRVAFDAFPCEHILIHQVGP